MGGCPNVVAEVGVPWWRIGIFLLGSVAKSVDSDRFRAMFAKLRSSSTHVWQKLPILQRFRLGASRLSTGAPLQHSCPRKRGHSLVHAGDRDPVTLGDAEIRST